MPRTGNLKTLVFPAIERKNDFWFPVWAHVNYFYLPCGFTTGEAIGPKQIQGPKGPKADSVPDGLSTFMEILFSLQAATSILTTRAVVVAGIGRVGGVGGCFGVLVQDHQGTDNSRNPSRAGEYRHNQERTTTLIQHCQWREDNR